MRKRLTAAALAAAIWIAYLPGNMGCSDSMWSIPTAVSLLDHHDATLDEYQSIVAARRGVLTQRIGGHTYTIYPLGTSLAAIPGVVVLRPIAGAIARLAPSLWTSMAAYQAERGCRPVDGEPVIALHSWSERAIASALVAATAAIVFVIAADELAPGWAIALAIVFAFGTSAWSTASRALWQHAPSMFLLALALLLQIRGRRTIWIGLVLMFAYVVRPTNAIPLAAAGVWLLATRPRAVPEFALGAAIVFVPFVISNETVYGSWLPPYFRPGFYSRNAFVAEALAGDLISPNRGLLVFSPVLALAAIGFAVKAASRRLSALDLSLAGCIVLHWIAIAASNGNWWGGHSYGPRFFADVLPYFIYFLVPAVAWMRSGGGAARRIALAAAAVLAAISVAMHAQGALNQATVAWNGVPINIDYQPARVWDWAQPQFLAGVTFTPRPLAPIDFDATPCAAPPGEPGAPVVEAIAHHSVALRWLPARGAVAVYVVEVGYRPGSNDLPSHEVRDVQQARLTVDRVPPGTYYARVVARNKCGISPPSPYVEVKVP
ncbi:MAG TPA: fibronectin type III domain-containing protein [Vicinamibacterales bacterium]|nr:fibronectin type III domain-containing protein [Vicinamibacterales bacterium]